MGKLKVTEAIILSERSEIRTCIRQELKKHTLESSNIHNVKSVKECKAKMDSIIAPFFLVLDWESGSDKVLKILELNRTASKIESRPTFLIAATIDQGILAVATEYWVSRVHLGELSIENIKADIAELVKEMAELTPIKQLMLQVETCRNNSDMNGATEILMKLYEKFPNNSRVAIELAENLMQVDKWDEAEKILDLVNTQAEVSARARHLYARCSLKRNNCDEAIDRLKDAQLISPLNINRLMELGDLFLATNRIDEAKEAYNDIAKIAPDSKEGVLGVSKGLLVSGQVNEALTLLRDAANSRELAAVFNTSAIIAIRQGDHAKGMHLYNTARELLSSKPKVLARLFYNMGIGFIKWGKPTEGGECFAKAHRLDPEFQDAAFNLNLIRLTQKSGTSKPQPRKPAIDLREPQLEDVAIRPLFDDNEIPVEDLSGHEEQIQAQGMSGFSFDLGNAFDDEEDDDI